MSAPHSAKEQDMANKSSKKQSTDRNPDPITGAPGSHPVGVGVGTAVGGAVTGAAAGAATGPVGAAAGAVVGGIVGGLAGKAVAESIDPTAEDAYWQENYRTRPYYQEGEEYDQYQPAYRYGWEAKSRYQDRGFEEIEPELEREWGSAQATSRLAWDRAKLATRDAWEHAQPRKPR
jgi:hypothetical protein